MSWIAPALEPRLHLAGLSDFDAWWSLPPDWIDEPNVARGGWSAVSRLELPAAGGGEPLPVFVKRQEDFITRTFAHPLGVPTLRRELEFLRRAAACGVRVPPPVCYLEQKVDGARRAVLCVAELRGMRSLADWMAEWSARGRPAPARMRAIVAAVARTVRRLHQSRIQHGSLYPKHVFLGLDGDEIEVALIDFEKSKRRWTAGAAMRRDLDSLNRRTPSARLADRAAFLRSYLGEGRVQRGPWRGFARRAARRR